MSQLRKNSDDVCDVCDAWCGLEGLQESSGSLLTRESRDGEDVLTDDEQDDGVLRMESNDEMLVWKKKVEEELVYSNFEARLAK